MIHDVQTINAPCPCKRKPPAAFARKPGRLGALECDQDGNCYQDGVLVSQPAPAAGTWQQYLQSPAVIVIAALVAIIVFQMLDTTYPRKKRR